VLRSGVAVGKRATGWWKRESVEEHPEGKGAGIRAGVTAGWTTSRVRDSKTQTGVCGKVWVLNRKHYDRGDGTCTCPGNKIKNSAEMGRDHLGSFRWRDLISGAVESDRQRVWGLLRSQKKNVPKKDCSCRATVAGQSCSRGGKDAQGPKKNCWRAVLGLSFYRE